MCALAPFPPNETLRRGRSNGWLIISGLLTVRNFWKPVTIQTTFWTNKSYRSRAVYKKVVSGHVQYRFVLFQKLGSSTMWMHRFNIPNASIILHVVHSLCYNNKINSLFIIGSLSLKVLVYLVIILKSPNLSGNKLFVYWNNKL